MNKLSRTDFCSTDGAVCPVCGKRNTSPLDAEYGEYGDGHEHRRSWECYDCGALYTAVYAIDGYEVDEPPTYYQPHRTCKALGTYVLAVAEPGAGDDWGVYIGHVLGKCHREEAESVVRKGSKQLKEVAVSLFPQFDPENYRD